MNTVYCKSFKVKSFVVAELNFNLLENFHGLDGGLAWPRPTVQAISLEKFLPIDPRKPRNFPTSNNLQHAVYGCKINVHPYVISNFDIDVGYIITHLLSIMPKIPIRFSTEGKDYNENNCIT